MIDDVFQPLLRSKKELLKFKLNVKSASNVKMTNYNNDVLFTVFFDCTVDFEESEEYINTNIYIYIKI